MREVLTVSSSASKTRLCWLVGSGTGRCRRSEFFPSVRLSRWCMTNDFFEEAARGGLGSSLSRSTTPSRNSSLPTFRISQDIKAADSAQ